MLHQEVADGATTAAHVVLTSSRLLLYTPEAADASDAEEGSAAWPPRLPPLAALKVVGVNAEALAAEAPRFYVRHSSGSVSFLAEDAKDAATWVEAISHVALPGGGVRAAHADAHLRREVASIAATPEPPKALHSFAVLANEEADEIVDAVDDGADGAEVSPANALLARVEQLLHDTNPDAPPPLAEMVGADDDDDDEAAVGASRGAADSAEDDGDEDDSLARLSQSIALAASLQRPASAATAALPPAAPPPAAPPPAAPLPAAPTPATPAAAAGASSARAGEASVAHPTEREVLIAGLEAQV